jgi:hypothetical protein
MRGALIGFGFLGSVSPGATTQRCGSRAAAPAELRRIAPPSPALGWRTAVFHRPQCIDEPRRPQRFRPRQLPHALRLRVEGGIRETTKPAWHGPFDGAYEGLAARILRGRWSSSTPMWEQLRTEKEWLNCSASCLFVL